MSISSEITRIRNARNTIRDKLVALGLAQSTDDIDDLSDAVTGIANRGAPEATVEAGETYNIQAGYYSGGHITGSGGSAQPQTKTVTPTKQQQNVTADDGYYLSGVTVNKIPDNYQDVTSVTAVAGDVLANKVIVNAAGQSVAGTMPNNGAVIGSIDGLSVTSYTIPAGYHNGSGTVSLTSDIETALAAI